MKALIALAVCLFAAVALAAPAPKQPATLTLTGPAEAAVGEEIEMVVTGVTLDELTKAVDDEQFDLTLWPDKRVDLDPTYNWMTRQIELELTAQISGEYLVKLTLVRNGKLEVADHVCIVGQSGPDPPDRNPYPAPTEWRRAVEPMTQLDLPPGDATRIAEWYARVAKTARTDNALQTTADLRAHLVATGKELGLTGKYPKMAAMHDVILANELTLINRPLAHDKAGDLLDGMAWAVWEAGHK